MVDDKILVEDLDKENKQNLSLRKIIDIDEETLIKITTWMYEWWGKRDGYTFEGTKCFMKYSLQKERLPQTYGLFLDNKIIGMYQYALEDLGVRPDIYPWLANVYIDEEYRNMGYGRKLLESVKDTAKNLKEYNEIFLYTRHINLYEKFGFEFVGKIDTYKNENRIQRLYKMRGDLIG